MPGMCLWYHVLLLKIKSCSFCIASFVWNTRWTCQSSCSSISNWCRQDMEAQPSQCGQFSYWQHSLHVIPKLRLVLTPPCTAILWEDQCTSVLCLFLACPSVQFFTVYFCLCILHWTGPVLHSSCWWQISTSSSFLLPSFRDFLLQMMSYFFAHWAANDGVTFAHMRMEVTLSWLHL